MEKISISQATRRDLGHVKTAARELWQEMQSPLFWLGLAIVVFFIVAPIVLRVEELPF